MPELAEIFARLSALLGPREGEPKPLGGGIVNRKFTARFGGSDYVVRLPRGDAAKLGIDRDSEYTANTVAGELRIAPAVATMLERPPCLVTEYVEGDAMSAQSLREPGAVAEVARVLRAFHNSGRELPARLDPFSTVREDRQKADRLAAELPDGYKVARSCARKIERALRGRPEHEPVSCNNDLVASSFLRVEDGIRIVDWEYAAMGDRYFDLGNFAVSNELDDDAEGRLLEAYFGEPPPTRRLAALRLMRFMSDFREAMWGVVQSAISEIDYPFDDYARAHFDRLGAVAEDPQLKRWLKEAAG